MSSGLAAFKDRAPAETAAEELGGRCGKKVNDYNSLAVAVAGTSVPGVELLLEDEEPLSIVKDGVLLRRNELLGRFHGRVVRLESNFHPVAIAPV